MCFLEPVSQSGVKNTRQACEPLCGCDPAPCPRCVPGGTLVTGSGSSRSQVEPILPCWGSPGSASPSSRAQDSGEDLYVGAFPERGACSAGPGAELLASPSRASQESHSNANRRADRRGPVTPHNPSGGGCVLRGAHMQQAAWGAVFHFQINTKHPCFPQELSCLPCCSFWVTGAPPGFVLSSSSAKQPARSWLQEQLSPNKQSPLLKSLFLKQEWSRAFVGGWESVWIWRGDVPAHET